MLMIQYMSSEYSLQHYYNPIATAGVQRKNSSDEHILTGLVTQSCSATSDP